MLECMKKRASTKRDVNQLAAEILAAAVQQANLPNATGKNPAAIALGRLGGLKGGKARAAKLSAKRRGEIARTAAQARWGNDNDSDQ
jgi:hypothetical protein